MRVHLDSWGDDCLLLKGVHARHRRSTFGPSTGMLHIHFTMSMASAHFECTANKADHINFDNSLETCISLQLC